MLNLFLTEHALYPDTWMFPSLKWPSIYHGNIGDLQRGINIALYFYNGVKGGFFGHLQIISDSSDIKDYYQHVNKYMYLIFFWISLTVVSSLSSITIHLWNAWF